MTEHLKPLTAADVRRAALGRWPNVEEVSVIPYTARIAGWDKALAKHLEGEWHALFLRRHPAGEWEPIARRRSLEELVEFIKSRPEV